MWFSSTETTTVHADRKPAVSEFRRALPQFCVVGVKNLILLGIMMRKNRE